MQLKKILDKIYKKADQIDALHHKASLLCDEIKDLSTDLEFTSKKKNKKSNIKEEYGKWKGNL